MITITRKYFVGLILFAITAMGIIALTTPAHAADTSAKCPHGTVTFINENTQQAMEVRGHAHSGAFVVQGRYTGTGSQCWRLKPVNGGEQIIDNAAPGWCLLGQFKDHVEYAATEPCNEVATVRLLLAYQRPEVVVLSWPHVKRHLASVGAGTGLLWYKGLTSSGRNTQLFIVDKH